MGESMNNIEYHIEPHALQDKELEKLGKDGWELIIAQPGGKWIFKRDRDSEKMPEPSKKSSTQEIGR